MMKRHHRINGTIKHAVVTVAGILLLLAWGASALPAADPPPPGPPGPPPDPPAEKIAQSYDDQEQGVPLPTGMEIQMPAERSESFDIVRQRVSNERMYVFLLSGVSILSLIIVLSVLRKGEYYNEDIVNASALIQIIYGTIILVLIVDTSEQLTAAIGVLGAIAGYLFGTLQERRNRRSPRQSKAGAKAPSLRAEPSDPFAGAAADEEEGVADDRQTAE